MNAPNINPEGLELPPGHRWVDTANEPFTREAKHITRGGLRAALGRAYDERISYCIPVLANPDPDTCAMLLDAADVYDATRKSGNLDDVDWPLPADLCAWASQNRAALEAGTKTEELP